MKPQKARLHPTGGEVPDVLEESPSWLGVLISVRVPRARFSSAAWSSSSSVSSNALLLLRCSAPELLVAAIEEMVMLKSPCCWSKKLNKRAQYRD
jgi:hypothetical protein